MKSCKFKTSKISRLSRDNCTKSPGIRDGNFPEKSREITSGNPGRETLFLICLKRHIKIPGLYRFRFHFRLYTEIPTQTDIRSNRRHVSPVSALGNSLACAPSDLKIRSRNEFQEKNGIPSHKPLIKVRRRILFSES